MHFDWWHVQCCMLYPVRSMGTDATEHWMQECDACTWHLSPFSLCLVVLVLLLLQYKFTVIQGSCEVR